MHYEETQIRQDTGPNHDGFQEAPDNTGLHDVATGDPGGNLLIEIGGGR